MLVCHPENLGVEGHFVCMAASVRANAIAIDIDFIY